MPHLQHTRVQRPLPLARVAHVTLADARAALAERLGAMSLQPPSVPLCCNGTGGWMEEATATSAEYWAAHVASPVRWADNMEALAGRAPATSPEVAPPPRAREPRRPHPTGTRARVPRVRRRSR